MYLVYVDESGNTGANLDDPQQPVFLLAGMLVPKDRWQSLEESLREKLRQYFPDRPWNFEIHATALRNGDGYFRGISVGKRLDFRRDCFRLVADHGVKLIYTYAVKRTLAEVLRERTRPSDSPTGTETFPMAREELNPLVDASDYLGLLVTLYLRTLGGHPLAILIQDENHEVMRRVQATHQFNRQTPQLMEHYDRFIEQVFFVTSSSSLPLQLCDLCAYSLRKHTEAMAGFPSREIDKDGLDLLLPTVVGSHDISKPFLIADLHGNCPHLRPRGAKKERPGT